VKTTQGFLILYRAGKANAVDSNEVKTGERTGNYGVCKEKFGLLIMRFSMFCLMVYLFFANSHAGVLSGFGAEGGLSLTSQKLNYTTDTKNEFVMKDWDQHGNAGIFFQFFDVKFINLDLDITYNQKGGLSKNGLLTSHVDPVNGGLVLGPAVDVWDRLDYISLSPRAKTKFTIGRFEPFFTIGPCFDFLIHGSSEFYSTDNFKKYEVSALYGVGVGYNINARLQSFFEFLHQPGITPICSELLYSPGGGTSNLDIANDVLKFNVGILYRL
jgi:hypothetical protein